MRSIFCFLLCLSLSGLVFSQNILAVQSTKKLKRVTFQPGEFIRFQTHDGDARYNGIIEAVDDSMIVLIKSIKMKNGSDETNQVFRDYVPLREIKFVYNPTKSYWKWFRRMYSGTAMIGGGMLIGITSANTLIDNTQPDLSSVLIASGILTSGLLVRYIGRDKYKIGKNWQLRAMEPMILPKAETEVGK